MYKDTTNYLYLVFLKPVLSDFQKINKCFQSNSKNATELLNDLMFARSSLKKQVIPPTCDIDIFETDELEKYADYTIYKGYNFETKLKSLKVETIIEKQLRDTSTDFLIELITQLAQR